MLLLRIRTYVRSKIFGCHAWMASAHVIVRTYDTYALHCMHTCTCASRVYIFCMHVSWRCSSQLMHWIVGQMRCDVSLRACVLAGPSVCIHVRCVICASHSACTHAWHIDDCGPVVQHGAVGRRQDHSGELYVGASLSSLTKVTGVANRLRR